MKNITSILLLLVPSLLFATHLRGGQINVEKISGLTCKITLRIFTNTGSVIQFGGGNLDFGDGSPIVNPPQTVNSPLGNLGPEFGLVEFSIEHTYPTEGFFIISYLEHNLNADILNISNSVEKPFYLESGVFVNLAKDYSSPKFDTDPILVAALKRPFIFSAAPIDSAVRYYQYKFTTPPDFVSGYQIPEIFKINQRNGLLSWDTGFMGDYRVGQFYFFVTVGQFDTNGASVGYVNRNFLVIVKNSDSRLDVISSLNDPDGKVVVLKDTEQKIRTILSDSTSSDSLRWSAYFDVKASPGISFIQYDSAAPGRKFRVGLLTLRTDSAMIRDYPYIVTLRGTSQGFSRDISYLYFTKDIDFPSTITGLEKQKEVAIYPNPFSDSFNVDGRDLSPSVVTVVNCLGQTMIQTVIDSNQAVDTRDLPPGVYVLQITSGPFITRRKVVKK